MNSRFLLHSILINKRGSNIHQKEKGFCHHGVIEKVFFNHKAHKVGAKFTKGNPEFHPDSYRDFVTIVLNEFRLYKHSINFRFFIIFLHKQNLYEKTNHYNNISPSDNCITAGPTPS